MARTQETPEIVTQEEKDFCDSVVYSLFVEWINGLDKHTEEEVAEEKKILAHFARVEGVKPQSPYAMLFVGFRAGLDKGLELVLKMEESSQSGTEGQNG